jgi:hypothetical protein
MDQAFLIGFAVRKALRNERARRAHTARATPKKSLGHMSLSHIDFRWAPELSEFSTWHNSIGAEDLRWAPEHSK